MKATTMTSETLTPWLTITSGTAGKLGRNGGEVGFRVLRDPAGVQLALSITSNSASGCWSPEIVTLDAIERCLPDDRQEPILAKTVARAFTGRSANQGPFATAVLLALGFLTRAAEHPGRYLVANRWLEVKAGLLSREGGEPYAPATKPGRRATEATADIAAMTRQEMPGDADAEDTPTGRKGRKGRPSKHAEADHGHAAPSQ